MCLAFFRFLRCGVLTIPDRHTFDPDVHLTINDICLDGTPAGLSVHIKVFKTDSFRQRITLHLGQTGIDLCPVATMADYLSAWGSSPAPLFHFQNGSGLHRQQLVTVVRSALTDQGFNASEYCSHSFRIGAATTAAQNGIADCTIKMLDRWESSAYQLYVRTPRTNLASYTRKLTNKLTNHFCPIAFSSFFKYFSIMAHNHVLANDMLLLNCAIMDCLVLYDIHCTIISLTLL